MKWDAIKCHNLNKKVSLNDALTGKDLICQTTAFFSGMYLAKPTVVLNLGESASLGTGMMTSTLFAVDLLLNWLFALIMYSTRE